jgi:hypothetical protein
MIPVLNRTGKCTAEFIRVKSGRNTVSSPFDPDNFRCAFSSPGHVNSE